MQNSVLPVEFEEIIWPVYVTRTKSTKKTISNLHQYLEKLSTVVKKDLCHITPQDASDFMDYLCEAIKRGEYKSSYVKVIYLSLRKFYDFLLSYQYDFRDQGILVPEQNPFQAVSLQIQDKKILTADDIPNLDELDTLLKAAREENSSLYLAICFAAKMGLSISEISNLRTSSLGYMKEEIMFHKMDGTHDKNLYLCLEDTKHSKRTKRYLKIPTDLVDALEESLPPHDSTNASNSDSPDGSADFESASVRGESSSYLISYKNHHYSERTMQYHLKNLCEKQKLKSITFADLRNLSVYLMKEGGAKDSEIAKYLGIEGRWLCRFSGISPSQVFGTADYSRIQIR